MKPKDPKDLGIAGAYGANFSGLGGLCVKAGGGGM